MLSHLIKKDLQFPLLVCPFKEILLIKLKNNKAWQVRHVAGKKDKAQKLDVHGVPLHQQG